MDAKNQTRFVPSKVKRRLLACCLPPTFYMLWFNYLRNIIINAENIWKIHQSLNITGNNVAWYQRRDISKYHTCLVIHRRPVLILIVRVDFEFWWIYVICVAEPSVSWNDKTHWAWMAYYIIINNHPHNTCVELTFIHPRAIGARYLINPNEI